MATVTDMAGQPVRILACVRCGKTHQPHQSSLRGTRRIAPYRVVLQRGRYADLCVSCPDVGLCVSCANREQNRLVAE